jgi:hypothetical protein
MRRVRDIEVDVENSRILVRLLDELLGDFA